MKRMLKLIVKIDFDKLMKEKKIPKLSEYSISKDEEEVISDLAERINKITNCRTIEMSIEDLKHKEYDVFEKSTKMGSKSGTSYNFKTS